MYKINKNISELSNKIDEMLPEMNFGIVKNGETVFENSTSDEKNGKKQTTF